jgi:predicted transposase/invertase (TIGR01784 family)
MTKECSLQKLNLENDFLFAKVMCDEEICRKVLEKILDIPIHRVVFPVSQKTIDLLIDSKGIRLDIYANDEDGTVYNCEIQRSNKKNLPKRSRYYQGNIDLDLISRGEPYVSLKKSFVIFICTFDPFSEQRYRYTFRNRCDENFTLILGDETIKIFLNTKGRMGDVSAELKEFLFYIEHTTDEFAARANSLLVKEIHGKVTEVKQNKKLEVEYMTLLERDRENMEKGIEQGIEKGAKIIKLYKSGQKPSEISEKLNVSMTTVTTIIEDYEKA